MKTSKGDSNTECNDTGKRQPVSGDSADGGKPGDDTFTGREIALMAREEMASSREDVAATREGLATTREDLASTREDVATTREALATTREEVINQAKLITSGLEAHISRLRQANGQLVITAVQAQMLTEEMQKANDRMGHMAHHDALTDLPNRVLLTARLLQTIGLAKRHGSKLAVLFIDLDRFKTINDSLGHAMGDALLQSVAQRLMASIRSTDTVSRQGGDEFVVLLSEVADEQAVMAFADKICQAIAAPYRLADQELHIGISIGISMFPDDGDDAETLIRNADVAMYHAKNSRHDRYHFFRPEMNARAVERQRVEVDIYRALKQHEFELYYQAQVDLNTGNVVGVEALIRWHHPLRGMLLPAVFMLIAEECGAIVPIGRWVLREACRQTQAWLDAGLSLRGVSINISAAEIGAEDFVGNVRTVLQQTGLAPQLLELELTETVLMKNTDSTISMLEELKAMGIRVAIDDFGTGYSSLSYLQQFPVDTLKIDQSFVAGIITNSAESVLVDAVIGLGKSLKHRVIAEGVETPEQLAFLKNHHCAEAQGYFLSMPMPAWEFAELLKTGVSPGLFSGSPS